MKGKLYGEKEKSCYGRTFNRLYEPGCWGLHLNTERTTLAIKHLLHFLQTIPLIMNTGSEFMPPLDEGSLLFMPYNASEYFPWMRRKGILQVQDAIIKRVPRLTTCSEKLGSCGNPDRPLLQRVWLKQLLCLKINPMAQRIYEKLISSANWILNCRFPGVSKWLDSANYKPY